MAFHVPRTCTEVGGDSPQTQSRALDDYRDAAAYVLLGDPGAGKTSCFKAEAELTAGVFITARDFLALGANPEWGERTLFIDGLDETRAGVADGRVPLDQIRRKLVALGRPRFRLSCREADWLGDNDRSHLDAVASSGKVVALRLDPLHESQVREILGHRGDVSDPQAFLDSARNHGVSDLLVNPQTLNLLVKAAGTGHWPECRQDVFELACRELTKEENGEHRGARRGREPPWDTLLDAAGRVCAVMLLANEPMISFAAESGCLSLGGLLDNENASAALATRLFAGHGGTERFSPVHRTVAEYVAARHLARRIAGGLPVGRVLALMTGPDGGVVSGLRGLHAWLAVHCAGERSRLIGTDPLGVVLYGDVRRFSTNDKERVLRGLATLAAEDPGFRRESRHARPFGALCASDMEEPFRRILTSPSREPAAQALADCVVDALHYGPWLPGLLDVLLAVIRDGDWWSSVRSGALDACLHHLAPDDAELVSLLDALGTGRVADDSDELLGIYLSKRYPGAITASRVFDFLHSPKEPHLIGRYVLFWEDQLPQETPTQDLPELLDVLAARGLPAPNGARQDRFQTMVGKLLLRGLEEWGDRIDGDRLFEWLGMGLDRYGHPRRDLNIDRGVKQWLSERPDRYKDVTECAVRKFWDSERPHALFYTFERYLYEAERPADLGRWLLTRVDEDPLRERAAQLFLYAISCLWEERGHDGLSFEFLDHWVGSRPEFKERWEGMLYCEIPDWQRERVTRDHQLSQERAARRKTRAREFREHLKELRQGAGHPGNFNRLAMAHEGRYFDVNGDSPIERLKDFLDDDAELVLAALSGLRQVPFRDDLPSVDEIIELDLQGQEHFLRLPCLVGAQMRFEDNSMDFLRLPATLLERLVTFRLTYWANTTPGWFIAIARTHPALFADVLVVFASRLALTPDKPLFIVHELHGDANYAAVARKAVPSLLGIFPSPASYSRLEELESVLRAGLQHIEGGQMAALIRTHLALDTLDDGQRTYLLVAGMLLDSRGLEAEIRQFLEQDPARAQHVMAFLRERGGYRDNSFDLSVEVAALLVRQLGSVFSKARLLPGPTWVTPEYEASRFVETLINHLAADPSEEAAAQIDALQKDPRLESWWPTLRYAGRAQRVAWRDAAYELPSPEQVQRTLTQGKPANAADLAELVGDALRQLAREIRDGNTDGYKQFWNLDQYARPMEPRVEEACRDTLLDRLCDRLCRLDIDSQPEGHYADDKRADIRISFGGAAGFNVPVEIKRDRHADLWRAMHTQLIAQYTRDPGAAGYGVYVVFWFGGDAMPAPPDHGARPTTASELEDQLRMMLSAAEKRLIQVCVIDVAKPSAPAR